MKPRDRANALYRPVCPAQLVDRRLNDQSARGIDINVIRAERTNGGGTAAFGYADRLTVIACCAAPGVRFAREGMPTPRSKDQ